MAKKQTSEFLFGDWLADRIRLVARGTNARLAVAFWSRVGIRELMGDGDVSRLRIICDIALGGTSEKALLALGAPRNPNLCHHERLHAKVYISDAGLVVGSANASLAALGDGGRNGKLLEAGTYHPAGSDAWQAAIDWFDPLFERSPEVREDELARAKLTYRAPRAGGAAPIPRAGSMLDMVRAAPERFADIGFVITHKASSLKDVEKARRSAQHLRSGIPAKTLAEWPRSGIFTGWKRSAVDRWPKLFVELWLKGGKLMVYGRTVGVFDKSNGSVLSKAAWPAIERHAKTDLPDRGTIGTIDRDLTVLLHGRDDGTLFANGHELASRLAEIERANPTRPVAWNADPGGERDPTE